MNIIIDGTYTLQDTLSAIVRTEQFGFALSALSPGPEEAHFAGSPGPVNYASLTSVQGPPNDLMIIVITDPQKTPALIASELARGWALILVSSIFVESATKSVAAFRKL